VTQNYPGWQCNVEKIVDISPSLHVCCDDTPAYFLSRRVSMMSAVYSRRANSTRDWLMTFKAGLCLAVILTVFLNRAQVRAAEGPDRSRPNIVVVFADDQGYADLGVFGSKIKTPNLDRMAAEGMKFTNFYSAQAVCSASRTGLLTGCYPNRVGILGALGPASKHGINPKETTVAEILKSRGYATAIYGKWHLGHHKKFLPKQHGFDDYFGLPYSNDMWPYHPTAGKRFPDLPLIEGDKIINPKVTPKDQTQLTTWYTERAVKFIEKNKNQPFFLYVPHSMPHVPLYVSDKFKGKSKEGIYGDVTMEIDWSVGQILKTLKKNGLDDNTLVIYTSDNGPWLSYGTHAGKTGPLREGKGTTWDGGQREPTIMRWPGKIPAGKVCKEVAGTIDILPTVTKITGGKLPKLKIDGKDIRPLMFGQANAKSPHEAYYFYWARHLQAIRSGKWKLHFPHAYRSMNGKPGGTDGTPTRYTQLRTKLVLYNLDKDIGEKHDVAKDHPEVVKRLKALAEKARKDLGDSATKDKGNGVRPPGRI
jgi:arylsulfatase A